MPTRPPRRWVYLPLALGLPTLAGSCTPSSPLADKAERDLRRIVLDAAAREISEAERTGKPRTLTRDEQVSSLGLTPQVLQELDAMAGPRAYAGKTPPLGANLLGGPSRTVVVNLERCVRTAVEHNIAIQFARISPAINESKVVAAEAAFDWTFFSSLSAQKTDSPRTQVGFSGSAPSGPTSTNQEALSSTIGVRRTLVGGGRFTIQQELGYTDDSSAGQAIRPNPANSLAYTVQYDQPLLRGLGSEVTQAEIRLARNAERNSIETLRRDVMRIVADTEKAYWQLASAQYDVSVLQHLLERGEKTLNILKVRSIQDANQAQIGDATARVARRRADLTRAQTNLKAASDRLKVLMNDPDLPVGTEAIIMPADNAIDEPVTFSLADSIRQAMLHRPEVTQAIIGIDDASIRRIVADNARLPDLNLRLQTRLSALNNDVGGAYGDAFDANFIDYVAGLSFEAPIGNKRPEAEFRQRTLERMQTVLAYRNTVQQVVQDVKTSLDRVALNYILIEQTRASRYAASEALRILELENAVTRGITPERLDLELNRQESLGQAEREEFQARLDYNVAITDLFAAMGTLLERNRIRFVVPTIDEAPWFGKIERERKGN